MNSLICATQNEVNDISLFKLSIHPSIIYTHLS
uniref:Uncharacterized protein n=1 Tax=Anguilla anguilla TaxID=7936 RepID=A0A0E9URS7_ANGAN